jgi:hypothetical protein
MKKLYIARPAALAAEPEPVPEPEPAPAPAPEEDIALLRQGSITDPERVGELLDRLTLDDKGRRGNAVSLAFMVKDNGVSMLQVSARAAARPPPLPAPPPGPPAPNAAQLPDRSPPHPPRRTRP